MYKKTLLSVAIASTLTLTGCLDSEVKNESNASNPAGPTVDLNAVAGGVYPEFELLRSEFPIPNDLMFDSVGDGTLVDLGVPNPLPPYSASDYNPVLGAIGGLSGASTSAPIDIKMSGLIDDAPTNPANALANNVFLIALDYKSGDPLQGLSIQEPPAPAATQPVPGVDYTIEHKELDGTSTLRIHPITPLNPLTRYIVVVTSGILDTQGNPIVKSPGVAGYSILTDADAPLASSALAGARALINKLWEPTAMAALSLPDDSNIALTYSFTTSGDEKVLNYIADPKQWFEDQINRFIGIKTVKSVTGYVDLAADGTTVVGEDYRPGGAEHSATLFAIGDADSSGTIEPGEVDAGDIVTAMTNVTVPAFPLYLSADAQTALGGLEALFPAVGCSGVTANGTNGSAYVSCLSAALAHPASPVGGLLPTPSTASIDFSGSTPATHPSYANVSYIQGTMEVPYYSRPPADIGTGAPAGMNAGAGAPLKYLSWEADDTLATAINMTFANLGLALPQGTTQDGDGNFTVAPTSTAVNYIFPFPKQQDADVTTPGVVDNITIPILAVYPTTHSGNMKTMIMGHGLGGSREIALGGTGAGLVSAFDVGGGVAAAEDVAVLAIDQPLHGLKEDTALLTKTTYERHFGYAEAGSGLPPRALDPADNTSLLFVNVESFLTTRDNNRQNVLDLLALRKSIGTIDIDGGGADLDSTDVYYQGYSLGTISAQAMLAVANDINQTDGGGTLVTTDNFESAFFSTPGGGISRFLENSPAFAPSIVTGLGAAGLTSDMSDYQTFLNVSQAAFDSFDAINFVGDYEAQGTKVLYYTASNDQIIPVSQVPGQTLYLPANATFAGQSEINASVSYLSGAEPLLTEANVTAIETAGADQAIDRNVIRFKPGAGSHFGPCPAATNADLEFAGYALRMLTTEGINVSATAQTDWIDAAPIEDFFVDATHCAPAP